MSRSELSRFATFALFVLAAASCATDPPAQSDAQHASDTSCESCVPRCDSCAAEYAECSSTLGAGHCADDFDACVRSCVCTTPTWPEDCSDEAAAGCEDATACRDNCLVSLLGVHDSPPCSEGAASAAPRGCGDNDEPSEKCLDCLLELAFCAWREDPGSQDVCGEAFAACLGPEAACPWPDSSLSCYVCDLLNEQCGKESLPDCAEHHASCLVTLAGDSHVCN